MTKHSLLAAGLAVALASMTNGVQARTSTPQTFMIEAMQGDLSEIQMGQLAEQKGASEQVKQFGQKLVSDHSANLEQAKSVAQSMGMTPPSAPNAKQKAMYDKLRKLSGNQFDREFARHMVQDHKEDIGMFQKQSEGPGPASNFAKESLPTLKQHLQIAQGLNKSTTGSGH